MSSSSKAVTIICHKSRERDSFRHDRRGIPSNGCRHLWATSKYLAHKADKTLETIRFPPTASKNSVVAKKKHECVHSGSLVHSSTHPSSSSTSLLISLFRRNIMPPRDTAYNCYHVDSLQERAAIELEAMRDCNTKQSTKLHPFPPACSLLLRSLPGNDACMDCGARHPEWATVSYGALICLECSGRHRSLGVQVRDNEQCCHKMWWTR